MSLINAYGTNAMNPSVEMRIVDESGFSAPAAVVTMPKFIAMIPVFASKGKTNSLRLFRSGEGARLKKEYGSPNIKNGVGMDLAQMILGKRDCGVYLINLRGSDAKMANAALVAKYKIASGVALTDGDNKPLYRTPEGATTTVAAGNTPIVIDTMTTKYSVQSISATAITSSRSAKTALDSLYNDTADAEGFKTIPIGIFYYDGAVAFGNNTTVRIVPKQDEITNKVLYRFELFDGEELVSIPSLAGFNPEDAIGVTSLFFQNIINMSGVCIKAYGSAYVDDFIGLIKKHLAQENLTIEKFDYLGGGKSKSVLFDSASVDLTKANAIKLNNGSDGDLTDKAALYKKLFKAEIVKDIFNPIRYQINFLPDVGYPKSILAEYSTFMKERYSTVLGNLEIGESSNYESALADYASTFSKTSLDYTLLLPAAGAAPRMNEYLRREVSTPFTFYWLNAWIDFMNTKGTAFEPFAHGGSEITGFTPGEMECPTYQQKVMQQYYASKINVPMAVNDETVAMYSQLMATVGYSDAMELNNAMIMQSIAYDILNLWHFRCYKFGEPEDVERFQKDVKTEVENKHKPYVSSIVTTLTVGTVGADKENLYIEVAVNCKNILKKLKLSLKYVA